MPDNFNIDQVDQLNTNPNEANYEKKIDKSINFIEFKKEIRKESIFYSVIFAIFTSVIANYIFAFLTK